MKTEIYNEIKKLENSPDDIQKRKGRYIRILADSISCFTCIDTKRSWKNKDNLLMLSFNGGNNCDIVGCYNCNNIGFISNSQINNLTYNGFKIFNINNNNWIERIEQLYNKASKNTNIMNKVNEWINDIYKFNIKQIEFKIESKIEPKIESKKESKIEPILEPKIKSKIEPMPLYEVCKRITKEYSEKSLDVEIEVSKIINIIKNVVETYFGNVFSLVILAKELELSFSICNKQSITTDKLIKIKDNNYLGIKTSTIITKNVIKTSLFGKKTYAKKYTADIFILKPLNQKAIEKANFIMCKIGEDMTDDILKEF